LVTERMSLGGIPLELVDTAGLREARDEAESIGIEKSRETLADADLVLVVLEAGIPIREDEVDLIQSLAGRHALIVRNKSDLALNHSDLSELNLVDEAGKNLSLSAVVTSAVTGQGIVELRGALLEMVRNPASESENGMLTNLRHREAVTAALASLTAAKQVISEKIPHEMLLLDLYSSLRQLDSLTGETTADDILNRIFSTFCIGK
jgi:tRNA modification GTPase